MYPATLISGGTRLCAKSAPRELTTRYDRRDYSEGITAPQTPQKVNCLEQFETVGATVAAIPTPQKEPTP